MICKNCGKENKDEMKFCGHCGHNLEGKIQCQGCKEWVNEDYNFCPFCQRKLKDSAFIINNNINLVSIITNSIIIIISIGLFLLMFGRIATYAPAQSVEISEFSVNVVDFTTASIKGLMEYTMEDFQSEEISGDNYMNKLNILKYLMVQELDSEVGSQRVFIYINLLIILAMMILPAILIGFAINDLVKQKTTNLYKYMMFSTFTLGLILLITIPLMDFNFGYAVVLYILLSLLGLLYSIIIGYITGTSAFEPKGFITKIISSISLFILTILTSTIGLAKYSYSRYERNYVEKIGFGKLSTLLNHLTEDLTGSSSEISGKFIYTMTRSEVYIDYRWLITIAIVISMFMVLALVFMIVTLLLEILDYFNLIKKYSISALFSWLAFITLVIVIILNYIFISGFKHYLEFIGNTDATLKPAAGIIILTVLILAYNIYKTIITITSRKTV